MKILRKFILIAAAAICAVSCFDDGPGYSATYTLDASFEYGKIFNADSLFFNNQTEAGFSWQDMAFYHKLNETKTEFLGGFILSSLKGNGEGNDSFRVNSGVGFDNSSSYAVFYENPNKAIMPEHDMEFLSLQYGTCSMIGCYVNNTKEVVKAFETFVPGDRLSVKMTGYLNGKATATREYLLAERTETKDSLVTKWSPFELDKLGMVQYVEIEVVSTKEGLTKSFCIDDMMSKVSVAY